MSLAFVSGIHQRPVDSMHKGPIMWKMFPFDDIIMTHWKIDATDAASPVFLDNKVNSIPADALALCISKPSASMVFIMQDKLALVFQEEGFQQPVPSQC